MPSKSAKKAKVPIVYWDSCIFISLIEKTPGRIDIIDELVTIAQNGELLIVTSTLTEAEVIQWPEDGISQEESNRKIADFFKNPWIIRRAVDTRVIGTTRRLRMTTQPKLKTPDAIHIATALIHEVAAFHTYDRKHLISKDGLLSDNGKYFLKISEPEPPNKPSDQPLFDATLKEG